MVNHKFCSIAILALVVVLVAISYRNISNEKERSNAVNYFTDIVDPEVERALPTLTSRRGTASMTLRDSISESGKNMNKKISAPATIVNQINYTGQTNILAPKIEINRNLGNTSNLNKNDPDEYYHL